MAPTLRQPYCRVEIIWSRVILGTIVVAMGIVPGESGLAARARMLSYPQSDRKSAPGLSRRPQPANRTWPAGVLKWEDHSASGRSPSAGSHHRERPMRRKKKAVDRGPASRNGGGRKALQLCRQVADTLSYVLAGREGPVVDVCYPRGVVRRRGVAPQRHLAGGPVDIDQRGRCGGPAHR